MRGLKPPQNSWLPLASKQPCVASNNAGLQIHIQTSPQFPANKDQSLPWHRNNHRCCCGDSKTTITKTPVLSSVTFQHVFFHHRVHQITVSCLPRVAVGHVSSSCQNGFWIQHIMRSAKSLHAYNCETEPSTYRNNLGSYLETLLFLL